MDEQMLVNISKQLDTLITMLTEEGHKKKAKIGRPKKEHIVLRFRERYPEFSKSQCVKITGLSIKTVSKYWNVYEKNEETESKQA